MPKIIIGSEEIIACPNCSNRFQLNEGITRQTIEGYEKDYAESMKLREAELRIDLQTEIERRLERSHVAQISALKEQLEDSKSANKELQVKVEAARQEARNKALVDFEMEKKALEQDLCDKEEKLKCFREQELQLRQEKQRVEDAKRDLELELIRKVDEEKKKIEESVRQVETERFKLIESEYRKKIEDAQRANEELKRKLEQGSQQLRGEVLELELENLLVSTFPLDLIEPVRKGVRGADVIHTVMTRSGQVCGKIIWEAKRAENWSNNWIPKLKEDQQAANAELGVLVTTTMPKQTSEPFLIMDGVWVVNVPALRPVAETLRVILLEQHKSKVVSIGRNEKMEALYDYMCSPQFAHRIRSVVDSYSSMKKDLESERSAMERLWKKREKLIDRVTLNMMGICGELQAIAQESLPQLDDIGLLPPVTDGTEAED